MQGDVPAEVRMTDLLGQGDEARPLVERLRDLSRRGHWPFIGDEAADEIERLNALRIELQTERESLLSRLARSGVEARREERTRLFDALADACVAAEIPDSKYESLLIALKKA